MDTLKRAHALGPQSLLDKIDLVAMAEDKGNLEVFARLLATYNVDLIQNAIDNADPPVSVATRLEWLKELNKMAGMGKAPTDFHNAGVGVTVNIVYAAPRQVQGRTIEHGT